MRGPAHGLGEPCGVGRGHRPAGGIRQCAPAVSAASPIVSWSVKTIAALSMSRRSASPGQCRSERSPGVHSRFRPAGRLRCEQHRSLGGRVRLQTGQRFAVAGTSALGQRPHRHGPGGQTKPPPSGTQRADAQRLEIRSLFFGSSGDETPQSGAPGGVQLDFAGHPAGLRQCGSLREGFGASIRPDEDHAATGGHGGQRENDCPGTRSEAEDQSFAGKETIAAQTFRSRNDRDRQVPITQCSTAARGERRPLRVGRRRLQDALQQVRGQVVNHLQPSGLRRVGSPVPPFPGSSTKPVQTRVRPAVVSTWARIRLA